MNEDCIKKYIRVLKDGEFWLDVFDRALIHSDMVDGRKVYSAGFIHTERYICFGRSESLDIDATPPIDNRLLHDGKILSPETVGYIERLILSPETV